MGFARMKLSSKHLCWVLLAVFAACVASQSNKTVAEPEINSSVLVFGPSDYVLNGGQSRCQTIVQSALAYKQSKLMFVPTAFWVDENYLQRKSVNSQGHVSNYCLDRVNGNGNGTGTPTTCPEATQAQIQTLTSSMAACFKTAVNAGLDIAISPHLDDGLSLGGWRNGLVFDPLAKYGASGLSYADFFLYPLADALAQSMTSTTKVLFAMQGEMSATVVYYPESYIQLLTLLKDRVLSGQAAGFPRSNVQIGVSTNFNKICGCVLQDLVDTYAYVQQFPAAFAPLKSQFNISGITDLYNQADFIGISSYPSLTPNFSTEQLEAATEQFDFEIGYFGVDLKDLNINKGKPLYWNEYGIGGGNDQNGDSKATTAVEAAQNPYFGIFGSYAQATDPWVLYNLSIASPVRDYLRYFYNQTIQYAEQTGKNQTFKYQVSGMFIWNGGSWDVQGIYPESTTSQGSYRDPALVPLISAHNTRAAQSTGTAVSSATAPATATNSALPSSTGTATGTSAIKPSATGTATSTPGIASPPATTFGRKMQ